jgi:transposase-like protein
MSAEPQAAALNGVVQTPADERLRELGETVRSEHALMVGAVNEAVTHAVALGEALLEAKTLVPTGSFTAWLMENGPDGKGLSSCEVYMRLAANKEHIDPTLSINANRDLVRGLARRSSAVPRISEDAKAEALRLYATGKFSPAEIARTVGTTRDTVRYWAEPNFAENKLRATKEYHRRQRAERRIEREQQPLPDRPLRYGEPGRAAVGRAVRELAKAEGRDATCDALLTLAAICTAWAERLSPPERAAA